MAEIKYLDLTGLGYYDGKIKSYIDTKVAAATTAATEAAKTATEYDPKINTTSSGTFEDGQVVLSFDYVTGNNDKQESNFFIPVVASTTNNNNGLSGVVTKEMHDKWNIAATKADTNETNISALTTKVDGLVTAGGEPNKIEKIYLNDHEVGVVDKAASIYVNLAYDSEKKQIQLQSETVDSGVGVISFISASDFIKDGMLESAEIIEVPGNEAATTDRPAGKYIKLTWNTDASKDATYIPVQDLLTEYSFKAGDEAVYGTTNKLGIKLTASTTTLADGTKETTYTPTISQTGWLTNVDNTLGALNTTYAAKSHTHTISEVTDLQTTLDTIKATADGAVQAADLKRIEDGDIDKLFTA